MKVQSSQAGMGPAVNFKSHLVPQVCAIDASPRPLARHVDGQFAPYSIAPHHRLLAFELWRADRPTHPRPPIIATRTSTRTSRSRSTSPSPSQLLLALLPVPFALLDAFASCSRTRFDVCCNRVTGSRLNVPSLALPLFDAWARCANNCLQIVLPSSRLTFLAIIAPSLSRSTSGLFLATFYEIPRAQAQPIMPLLTCSCIIFLDADRTRYLASITCLALFCPLLPCFLSTLSLSPSSTTRLIPSPFYVQYPPWFALYAEASKLSYVSRFRPG